MKEAPLFEQVAGRLLAQAGFTQKILIGGLLSFIPVVNLFAFGYLSRYSMQIRRSGDFTLPAWGDWGALFREGIPFLVVWLAYWVLPLAVGAALYFLVAMFGAWYIGVVVAGVVFAAAPVLFSAALYRLQTRGQLADLRDILLILKLARSRAHRFIVPSLVFVGIFAIAWPLLGFAFFIGFILLIAYASLMFRLLEEEAATFRF